jgi:hypothetical protein
MAKVLMAVALVMLSVTATRAANGIPVEPKYLQLPASEIRKQVVGMAITDDAHWSDHFYRDGTLKSYDLGRLKRGTWKLDGNELCLTHVAKSSTTDCFEIWSARDAVQYRRDGVVVADGYLRAIPDK